MTAKHVAIVGATGAVGLELLQILEERKFPLASLRLLASSRSAGQQMQFAGEALTVEELTPLALQGVDIALFSAGSGISREYATAATDAGAVIIDNSSAFRMDAKVPLVVPELNPEAIQGHSGIIANPNCSTIILCMVLGPLHKAAGLGRVVVATYQAASGAGQQAMHELRLSTQAALAGEDYQHQVMPHSLAFNLFPQVDVFMPDAYTKEEDKMLYETRKILGLPELQLEATCVRVPVERSHSESVTIELLRPLSPDQARQLLGAAPGVELVDEPSQQLFPQPKDVSGRDPVLVGRIRQSRAFAQGLALWVVGDQLRKGAALNTVQIAELV